jgi:hypothetical protein
VELISTFPVCSYRVYFGGGGVKIKEREEKRRERERERKRERERERERERKENSECRRNPLTTSIAGSKYGLEIAPRGGQRLPNLSEVPRDNP